MRVVDAGTRRMPLQRKVGASLTAAEFTEQEKTGRFGHIGMRESVALVGRQHRIDFLTVEPGQVAGIHNVGRGMRGADLLVELDLKMYVGAPDPRDEVHLTGSPDVHLRFDGGIPGDQATAAVVVNSGAQVVAAAPGLKTVLDLPAPRLVR